MKNDPIHYPEDRRFRIWLRKPALIIFLALLIIPLVVAWLEVSIYGLPTNVVSHSNSLDFPLWLRIAHFLNIIFLLLLMRSGLSIFMDHPRLYWNDHCTPGTEWLRFTPIEVPTDKVWTAKDDARYISPWFALPGYRHTIGMARHWHFLTALVWFLNGLVYVTLLFVTGEWPRIVPTSLQIIPGAWSVFVHYATFNISSLAHVANTYNPLQQLSYFGVIFFMAPLSVVTGLALSPAISNRFPWYPKIFGGRQSARSIHFLLLIGYIFFVIAHVTMVIVNGFAGNMNEIARGLNDGSSLGIYWGIIGAVVIILICWLAHFVAWHYPRIPQRLTRAIHLGFMQRIFFSHLKKSPATYTKADISPRFWPNGKIPISNEWKELAAHEFKNYRLKITGLVENPTELSLSDLKALERKDQITMHNCIQGWNGIAHWAGVPLSEIVRIAKPKAEAKAVVFHSFGDGLYGGEYYDTQRIEDIAHPQCILAYEMNYASLPELYGAPLRLRAEKQLGYKMVKWIKSIEFVADTKSVGKGYGGKNEDDEYFDLVPEI